MLKFRIFHIYTEKIKDKKYFDKDILILEPNINCSSNFINTDNKNE